MIGESSCSFMGQCLILLEACSHEVQVHPMLHQSHVDHHWVLHMISLEHFDGTWFLPMILEAQRLTGSNTDVSGVPGGEGLPPRARYRPYFYPGLTLQLVLVHAPATCTIPSGQMSAAV